jgi:hypothetical protein
MAENHIELIATILLFFFGVTMLYQGHLIYHGKRGYLNLFRQRHEQDRVRKQVEDLVKGK